METLSSSTSVQPASQERGRRLHGFTLFSVLTALMLTLLLEALDQTVVSTALPKIVASLEFLHHGGKRVIITSPDCLPAALRGETGTHIVNEGK